MGKIENEKQGDHEYERLNPGAEPPSPHRPEEKSPKEKGSDRSSDMGGKPPEKVEDRPNVSTVRPEDYPDDKRKNS